MIVAERHPFLDGRVSLVLGARPKKDVLRIHAQRNVAAVTRAQVGCNFFARKQGENKTVRVRVSAIIFKATVAIAAHFSKPDPTAGFWNRGCALLQKFPRVGYVPLVHI
jgi:hypothetical protein